MPDNKLNLFYIELGQNISSLRNKKKIKQEAIASHLGLSRISISNIETGKQRIQLHALLSLAGILQVSINDLLPSLNHTASEITDKLAKKISNTEIANDKESLDKAKDFIMFSKSAIKTK